MSKILNILALISIVFISAYIINTIVHADYDDYITESRCVSKLIAKGVPRSDIYTEFGTCYVIHK